MITTASLSPIFTEEEQIQFLETRGWLIEKRDSTVWVQNGPYDNIGEYQDRTVFYAYKDSFPHESLDRVFRREFHSKFKAMMLN